MKLKRKVSIKMIKNKKNVNKKCKDQDTIEEVNRLM